ncbi:hypothetical protein [Streptomyces lonegramiae]|uniref:Uncharacterized protein n=1 Tax=Streptomyces lonegramiae TaxID=3075524 RepID=A0ABU2XSE7_9ACTN|nr:hypothetical protein [Streptomyces sp. DSM 41529]MDT0547753.1 hypothetical protein [Streptomyces sp. DSM 41529]
MYTLPVSAKIPSLEDLQSGKAQMTQPREPLGGRLPMETVGPAARHLPLADKPSGMAELRPVRLSPTARPTYPEPPRSMTRAECKKGLQGGKLFYVKSRFAMCTGIQMIQTWAKNGTPAGQSSFTLWVISTVPDRKDRTVKYDYLFTDFFNQGRTGAGTMKVNTDVETTTWPSGARKREGGAVPPTKTFNALKASPKYQHTVIFDAGQGRGKDDVIAMSYQPYVNVIIPPNWVIREGDGKVRVGFLAAQWDAAKYLYNASGGGNAKKKGGAYFPVAVYLPYSSKTGAPERAVALHLQKAHTKPRDTKPVNSNKNVPGFGTDRKLHRLYHDGTRRDKNRDEAIKVCRQYWGNNYPQGGKDCDEYPFAITYEGCAQSLPQYEPSTPKKNFSAMPLPKADNGNAGTILAGFLTKNRIVDGRIGTEEIDGFMVKIT